MNEGRRKRRSSGFTLIELLVVIAIIALLAAILFPIFISAKSTAKKSSCASNLRQIGTAFRAYMDDWSALLPPQADGYIIWMTPGQYGYGPNAAGWTERLFRYHKKVDIYKCPARRVNFGYGYNGHLGDSTNAISPRRPTKLILCYDCPGSGFGPISPIGPNKFISGNADQTNEGQNKGNVVDPDMTFDSYSWRKPDPAEMNKGPWQYHSQLWFPGPHVGHNNILFYDGHVKSFSVWQNAQMSLAP